MVVPGARAARKTSGNEMRPAEIFLCHRITSLKQTRHRFDCDDNFATTVAAVEESTTNPFVLSSNSGSRRLNDHPVSRYCCGIPASLITFAQRAISARMN